MEVNNIEQYKELIGALEELESKTRCVLGLYGRPYDEVDITQGSIDASYEVYSRGCYMETEHFSLPIEWLFLDHEELKKQTSEHKAEERRKLEEQEQKERERKKAAQEQWERAQLRQLQEKYGEQKNDNTKI